MKIKQLKIEGFGKLINQTYDFKELTIFIGNNETGKSTILAFIKYMLFGFENATTSNQNYNPLDLKRYGGQIHLSHEGKEIQIERVKILRSGKPSFSCEMTDGETVQVIDETTWRDFIRPLNAKVFSEIYSVTQDNLQISTVKDYNAERLDEEWRMSATTGTVALFDQVQLLSRTRDDIFTTTRASKKPLNQALVDIAAVKEAIDKKTSEEAALLPLMARNDVLSQEIAMCRVAQEKLDDEINQSKHRLSYLSEYQEFRQLQSQDLTNILSSEEADNLRQKHGLHEKYSQELAALNQKISENTIALEKLDTPKNQFLKNAKTTDRLDQVKLAYPLAISAEQQIEQLTFSKHYLIIAIISLILMGVSFLIKPLLVVLFLIVSIVMFGLQVRTSRIVQAKLAKNQAVLSDFDIEVAYFSDWLPENCLLVADKIAVLTNLDKEVQELKLLLSRYDQRETIEKMTALQALDNAIFEELPDIDTAPKLLAQWAQQSRDLLRLTRLKEQLSAIFDLATVFNGNKEQMLVDQKITEKAKTTVELNSLIDEHSRNLAVINQQKTDTTLADLSAKLARKKEVLRDYLLDFTTKSAEIRLIEAVMMSLSSETLPDILKRASSLFSHLTDQVWREIYLEKEILWVENSRQQSLRLIDLSTGTRDQLQLALRLAFIQSKHQDFPIFLDDNFLRFDSKRRLNFSNMLASIAKDRQVILLTSDQGLALETEGTISL
ncbi:MAG: AAA family ATPase [Lactococcus sp.]|nr:AAA family ATPase [Lactococcus sp.]MDN5403227.1 AAA family ATPase [Lactococcus sp.]MDN5409959.1 AAA family ATPase [Lactococcus sp.]MDN5411852.1 AAA family ATPase [Lactococcus sp.]MDN5436406.1 AAA family ATPase [Lactococcus sp.]MDN5461681.1 AAA family ATPase [Lactococcus sp.]